MEKESPLILPQSVRRIERRVDHPYNVQQRVAPFEPAVKGVLSVWPVTEILLGKRETTLPTSRSRSRARS